MSFNWRGRDAWLEDEAALDEFFNGPRCPDCDVADLRGELCDCQKQEDQDQDDDGFKEVSA